MFYIFLFSWKMLLNFSLGLIIMIHSDSTKFCAFLLSWLSFVRKLSLIEFDLLKVSLFLILMIGAPHLRDIFYRMGLSDKDIVALSGGHTLVISSNILFLHGFIIVKLIESYVVNSDVIGKSTSREIWFWWTLDRGPSEIW